MPSLTNLVFSLQERERLHDNFRLWLVTDSFEGFPPAVLKQSERLTLEGPTTVKHNALAALSVMPEDIIAGFASATPLHKRLLYAVVLFHAAAQARRQFGPLGWNTSPAFTVDDLVCSLRGLPALLDAHGRTGSSARSAAPMAAIKHMVGVINYGGRVTDEHDRSILAAMLDLHLQQVDAARGATANVAAAQDCATLGELAAHVQAHLPEAAAPEAFGMHSSASFALCQQVCRTMRFHACASSV